MTDSSPAPTGPTTAEGFLADRVRFWGSFTKFTTAVAAFLVVLLVLLWIFLV
jgi:hypothetical protein